MLYIFLFSSLALADSVIWCQKKQAMSPCKTFKLRERFVSILFCVKKLMFVFYLKVSFSLEPFFQLSCSNLITRNNAYGKSVLGKRNLSEKAFSQFILG